LASLKTVYRSNFQFIRAESLPSLTELDLSIARELTDVENISLSPQAFPFVHITHFSITSCSYHLRLPDLGSFSQLTNLTISLFTIPERTLSSFASLHALTDLKLIHVHFDALTFILTLARSLSHSPLKSLEFSPLFNASADWGYGLDEPTVSPAVVVASFLKSLRIHLDWFNFHINFFKQPANEQVRKFQSLAARMCELGSPKSFIIWAGPMRIINGKCFHQSNVNLSDDDC
jgi:hypothetical protein